MTDGGIVICVSPEQLPKALSPMLVMVSGIVIEVRLEQDRKARPFMLVTVPGIDI